MFGSIPLSPLKIYGNLKVGRSSGKKPFWLVV